MGSLGLGVHRGQLLNGCWVAACLPARTPAGLLLPPVTHPRRLQVHCRRRRVAKATGGSIVMTLADMEGNETFDPANLGSAEAVVEETVGDNDMVMIRGPKNTRAVTGGAGKRAGATGGRVGGWV